MFEDETMAVETREAETQAPEDEIGKLWDDDGETVADQVEEESGEAGGETSPQDADKPGGTGDKTSPQPSEESKEEKSEEGEQAEEGKTSPPETFTLRHMDDPPVTVGREEVVRLAQQGLDYERVRTERDQLREYRAQADPALNLVKTFAENSGMSLEDYVDYCRTQAIMAGEGVDEATARAKVSVEKQQAKLDAQTRAAQAEQQRQQAAADKVQAETEARKQDMLAFIGAYPGVKAEDIPKEVWDKVTGGQSLVSAYTMWQNQQLKAQIAAEKQNKENAAKAPGSMKSQGEKGRKTLADYWDEAET